MFFGCTNDGSWPKAPAQENSANDSNGQRLCEKSPNFKVLGKASHIGCIFALREPFTRHSSPVNGGRAYCFTTDHFVFEFSHTLGTLPTYGKKHQFSED